MAFGSKITFIMVTFFRMGICANDIYIEGSGAMCGTVHQPHYNPPCQRGVELHPTSQSRQPAFHAKAESGPILCRLNPNEDVCSKFSGMPMHHHTETGLPADDPDCPMCLGFDKQLAFDGMLPTQCHDHHCQS